MDLRVLATRGGRQLLSLNPHITILRPLLVLNWRRIALIDSRDNLMQLEFNLADVLLRRQIMALLLVFHVEGLQLEGLLLFEEIVHLNLRHEVRIQIIIDAFSSANLLLHSLASLFLEHEKNNECVRFGKRVEIWQVSHGEGKTELLFQLFSVGVTNAAFDGLQCCIIDVLACLLNATAADSSCIILRF